MGVGSFMVATHPPRPLRYLTLPLKALEGEGILTFFDTVQSFVPADGVMLLVPRPGKVARSLRA